MAEKVWAPHPTLGFTPAILTGTDTDTGVATVKDVASGEIFNTEAKTLIPYHQLAQDMVSVEDLTKLLDLHSASLLEALDQRFHKEKIYTRTGQILIAVNPFQRLKSLYGASVFQTYTNLDTATVDRKSVV